MYDRRSRQPITLQSSVLNYPRPMKSGWSAISYHGYRSFDPFLDYIDLAAWYLSVDRLNQPSSTSDSSTDRGILSHRCLSMLRKIILKGSQDSGLYLFILLFYKHLPTFKEIILPLSGFYSLYLLWINSYYITFTWENCFNSWFSFKSFAILEIIWNIVNYFLVHSHFGISSSKRFQGGRLQAKMCVACPPCTITFANYFTGTS